MIPLSLYIHMPWCIRKCPYCDFNSHQRPDVLPEKQYIQSLLQDLSQDLLNFPARPLTSIFFGGGTPSLFSAESYNYLLTELKNHLPFTEEIEITLEANPGSVEQQKFSDYRALGINRLSLGIQSFNDDHLRQLGRVHDSNQAHQAINCARMAGFNNLNIDIMHTLPNQSVQQGLMDLQTAISYQPEHLSWYQLTIEPNTLFYKHRPVLPTEKIAAKIETEGLELLSTNNYNRYEISAFCTPNNQSRHNLNYWMFGDYLGIGAGAHGKLSDHNQQSIRRTRKRRQPKDYLNADNEFLAETIRLDANDLVFEFMLNATRLEQMIPHNLFTDRTGLSIDHLMPGLQIAQAKGLLTYTATHWQITAFGRRYTNDLQELFFT